MVGVKCGHPRTIFFLLRLRDLSKDVVNQFFRKPNDRKESSSMKNL